MQGFGVACIVTELGVWLLSEGWSSLLLEDGAAFDESSRAEAWGRGAVGCSGRKLSQADLRLRGTAHQRPLMVNESGENLDPRKVSTERCGLS